jgi:hypothetical protein
MARRRDAADDLRDALLSLALIPIAGLHTASYWFKETLERSSKLGTDLIASTALGRTGGAGGAGPVSAAVADVLSRDLLEAARNYVRAMVSLPTDAAIHFTGELERRLQALLAQLQPDATTDLDSYVGAELARLLHELDRLALIARSEAARPSTLARRTGGGVPATPASDAHPLTRKIEGLRARAGAVRRGLHPRRVDAVALDTGDERAAPALDLRKALTRFRDVLDEAEALDARRRPRGGRARRTSPAPALLRRARKLVTELDELATRALTSGRRQTG